MNHEIIARAFPAATALLNLFAAMFYVMANDYARAVYWMSAATLTLTVTFWID